MHAISSGPWTDFKWRTLKKKQDGAIRSKIPYKIFSFLKPTCFKNCKTKNLYSSSFTKRSSVFFVPLCSTFLSFVWAFQ